MKKISDRLYVAPQLNPEDMSKAKAQGFTAIVNNRPDGEEPGQPAAEMNRQAAAAAGLCYTYIPVVAGRIGLRQVRDFQQALAASDGPVLAHCRTGTRSAILHAIGEVLDGRMSRADVLELGQLLRLDLSPAIAWLDIHGRRSDL